MDQSQKSGVERLKDKLYSRKEDLRREDIRTPLEAHESSVPPRWKEPENPEPEMPAPPPASTRSHMSLPVKFFFSSVVFFLLAAGVSAFVFFNGGNLISPQNIDLEIVAPSLIDGGKAATFQIIATNRNQSDLILVDMIIDYPDGTRSATDASKSLTHERQSIGTIKSGQQIKRTVSGIFYGQEGAPQQIKVSLEYSVVGSNAVFEKEAMAEFTLGSSPVSISIDAPTEAISGDEFPIKVSVRSNATTALNNVVIQGQYPFGFSVVGATPLADAGGTLWRLGTLNPGDSREIVLRGRIQGQDGDERIFRFQAGSNSDQTDTQIKVPFLTMPHTLTVHKPFVTGSISVEGQSGKTVSVAAGKTLQGVVRWENNLSDSIGDAELVLTFVGPALDKNSVQASNGFYQSGNSSIIWSKSQDPSLANVPPGTTGTQFSFATLPPGSGNVLITNPTISLNLQVRGTRKGQTSVPESIGSAASLNVQLASAASVQAQTFHFSGPFTNIGPMPPRAETATTYSIVLTVKNSSNALANTVATTVLPPYVNFMSAIPGEGVVYDAASRTVRWPIGELKAGVGYTLPTRQAAFQVTLNPSTSQIGQAPALTGPIQLSGTDRFAQVTVESQAPGPTTRIAGEIGFTSGMDIVAPKQ
jgi:hypothetical protein